MMQNIKKTIFYEVAPILVIVILVLFLEVAVDLFKIPSWLMAKPSVIFVALVNNLSEILPNMWSTIREIVIGYIIGVSAGITLALIFSSNDFIRRAVSPYVIFLIVTPQIILVPLLMLWMGFGMQVKIAAVALSSFPINMISTMTGVKSVSKERYELMRSLRATKIQTFFQVLIPSALPNVFTGMRLATIFATTSAVGAELISGNIGVGPRIAYHTEFMQVDFAFAYVLVMILVSVSFYMLVSYIENKVVKI